MGLFDFFKSNSESNNVSMQWNSIESEAKLEEIIEKSNIKPQIIFKHSSSCGVSYFAKRSLDTEEIVNNPEFDSYLVDVIRDRSLSLKIAEIMSIRHESPQLLIIKNGIVSWHGSHNSVRAEKVFDAIN